MKSPIFACVLAALILPPLANSAAESTQKKAATSPDVISGPPLADLPNFPIGYDIIQGTPPDGHITRWIRYVIVGLQNHPFPIVFFSPQEFKPKTALELLIILSNSEYKSLSAFSRTQPCMQQQLRSKDDEWPAGQITEYERKKTTRCSLLPTDACNYLLGLVELPDIKWTPAQLELIHRIAAETNCKTSKSDSSS